MLKSYLSGLLLFLLASFVSNYASAEPQLSPEEIKKLALEAILENPEIIQEAIERLEQIAVDRQREEIATIITERRGELERDENAPVLGNPDGDVTIVEFFDYNCPYCKRVKPQITALLEQDNNVRLVYREWPILGPGSVYAARAALASRKQGKYEEFHWALMGLKSRAEERSVLQAAKSVGLDIKKLEADMDTPEVDQHIGLSMELAQVLNITGTPTFIVGDALAPGLILTDQLLQLVQVARGKNQ